MPQTSKTKIMGWPKGYPLAQQAAKERDRRQKARQKRGHVTKPWVPPVRYARSYKRGDEKGKPTGPYIVHILPNRHERRSRKHEGKPARR